MKKILLIISIALITFHGVFGNYSEPTNINSNVIVQGKIIGTSDYTDIYLENISTDKEIGSSKIGSDGSFKIMINLASSDFFKLRLDKYNYIILIIEPNENIKITVSVDNFSDPTITGSPSSALLYKTLSKVEDYDKKIEEFKAKTEKEKETYLESTFKTNSNSLAGLFFINQIGNPDITNKILSNLKTKYPKNLLVKEFAESQTPTEEKVAIGSIAPEIKLPSPDGKEIALSSLRGKVVLIDFWASWCGPCLREAPNLVAAYEKYHSKGFEIFGVSLDAKKDDWVNGISKYNLNWVHVSDLKYWESMAVDLYGFDGIPHTVLIDENGRVIAKDLRGEQLKKELAKILK